MRRFLKVLQFAFGLLVCVNVAIAQEVSPFYDQSGKYAGSYLCIADAAGGLRYEKGDWKGTIFNTHEMRVIIKIKNIGSKGFREFGKDYRSLFYAVEIGRFGDTLSPCEGIGSELGTTIRDSGYLQCVDISTQYMVNLERLRYFEVFSPVKWLFDNVERYDTPNITVGKCSKISD